MISNYIIYLYTLPKEVQIEQIFIFMIFFVILVVICLFLDFLRYKFFKGIE